MSFFRYPGGKSKLKKQIIGSLKLDKSKEFREPFVGGGSIFLELLEKNAFTSYWINDKDPAIIALWLSVQKYPTLLKSLIKDFIPSIDDFYEIQEELLGIESLPSEEIDLIALGFKKLVIHQISYSGLGTKSGGPLGGKLQDSVYKIDCRWSPDYLCKKIDKIHNLFCKVNLKITCEDYENLILNDDKESVIYLDPPYYGKGNQLYQYGFTTNNHLRLAELLQKTILHFWLLSYDDCREILDIYSNWAAIETVDTISYSITSARTRSELLIFKKEERQEIDILKELFG